MYCVYRESSSPYREYYENYLKTSEETHNNNSSFSNFSPNMIENVKFYPPATKMFFKDGSVTTSVAHKEDKFDPSIGMMICIFKYIFKGNSYNNMFRRWIKKAKEEERKKIEEELKKIQKEETRERRAKKKAAKKLLKKIAKREEEIEIQKEAYLRAMKEISAEKEKKCIE